MIEKALQKVLGFGVQTFVEKAIEGGWKGYLQYCDKRTFMRAPHEDGRIVYEERAYEGSEYVYYEVILLDPAAWQAVGKVSWWNVRHSRGNHSDDNQDTEPCDCTENDWKKYWHRFIDALAEEHNDTT